MPLSSLRRPLALATGFYLALLAALRAAGRLPPPPLCPVRPGRAVRVQGVVLSGLAPKRQGDRFWLGVGPAKIQTFLPPGGPRLLPGQRVEIEGRLRAPRPALNPGEFDERSFLADRGASGVLHGRGIRMLDPRVAPTWKLLAAAEAAHQSLAGYLKRRFSREDSALLMGFLLGYKGPIASRLNRQVQDAGVMHLIVPSGAKVAFVWAFTAWLGLRLRLAWGPRSAATAATAGFYVLMAGAEPPYTRAYFAALAMTCARRLGRETGAFSGLLLSAALTLALRPRAAFETGFQMTYLATGALMIALPRWRFPRGWSRGARRAASLILASLIVQASLWPVFAGTFGRGSLAGAASNLLLIPASGLVMGAGFLAWGLSFLPGAPDGAAAGSARILLLAFKGACAFFSSLPGAAIDLSPWSGAKMTTYYLVLLGFLLLPSGRSALRAWAAAAAVLLGSGLGNRGGRGEMRAVFLGLPRGYAAVFDLPDGRRLAVASGLAALRGPLRALGGRAPDSVCVPRPGAAPFLLRQGRLRLTLAGGRARARREGAGPAADYCIMGAPTGAGAADCPPARSFFARRDGAVALHSDGESLEITTFRGRDTRGRPFP